MNKTKGLLALLLCAVIFASFSVLIRLLNNQLSAFQQILFRHILAFVFIAIIAITKRVKWNLHSISKRNLFIYSITFPFAITFFTLAVLKTKISTAVFCFYIGTLSSSLLIGKIFFKEKITQIKIVSLFFSLIGLFLFTYPFSLHTLNAGLVFGLLGGFADATCNAFRKLLGNSTDRIFLVFIQILGGLLLSLLLIVITRDFHVVSLSTQTLGIGIIYGAALLSISYLMIVGFSNFDLNLGTVVLSSELIFAPVFAMLAFGEIPTGYELLGGIFIILAIVIPNVRRKTK